MILELLASALELMGKVSHLSGFWWLVGGVVAYAVVCFGIFSLMKIAAISDQHSAEIGGR